MLYEASQISQDYLAGKFILIVILSVLYGLGFFIIGIKYAVLAAVFSIIPYIGNIIGGVLALILAVVTKGSTGAILGVVVVMSIAQFLESYILEPLVVGKKVELNLFFTILIVVLGGAVWGIPGMIVAIPYLGIVKVILDRVKPLTPYAYLIGEDESSGDDDLMSKVKGWFKK